MCHWEGTCLGHKALLVHKECWLFWFCCSSLCLNFSLVFEPRLTLFDLKKRSARSGSISMTWKVGESRAMLGNWDALYCTWWSFSLSNLTKLRHMNGMFYPFPLFLWRANLYTYEYINIHIIFLKAFLYVSRLLFNVYVCMASVMENFDVVCALLAYCKTGTILTPPAPSLPLSVCNKEVVTFFWRFVNVICHFFKLFFVCETSDMNLFIMYVYENYTIASFGKRK